mgnify:CR=1 FL=1
MAVRFEGARKRWSGLSTDTKPLPDPTLAEHVTSQLPVESTFREVDTGDVYHWTGAGWVLNDVDERLLMAVRGIGEKLDVMQRTLALGLDVDLSAPR